MLNLTYCTNVHPLLDLNHLYQKIGYFGPKIAHILNEKPFALGLWFNAEVVEQLKSDNFAEVGILREFLEKRALKVYTLNSFPYGNFHQEVVKKKVYEPSWARVERLQYTVDCAEVLARLTTEELGTISTLPLGWRENWGDKEMQAATKNLIGCCESLQKIKVDSGKQIQVCLEPEPGCVLQRTPEVIRYWNKWLRPAAKQAGISEGQLNAHLGLCYDTCHQAVQFEDANQTLTQLEREGIPIGKMQLSSALEFRPDPGLNSVYQRRQFEEKKFLHQTRIASSQGILDFDDLSECFDLTQEYWLHPWRVHYHLPLFAQQELPENNIRTTVGEMEKAFHKALRENLVPHFEIETYTWTVLPPGLKPDNDADLAAGIAREFSYVKNLLGGETF